MAQSFSDSKRIRIRLDTTTRIKLEELARCSDMTLGQYLAWVVNRFLPPVQIRENGGKH
jgi:hypothetical protein